MKKVFLTSLVILFFVYHALAQNNGSVEMADALRNSGKIYVVVTVVSVIFVGLAFYLFAIDRRIKKLEDK